ncbi:MAG: LLM class F420-dependent oxidoreductase, partial [Dehalococcoidia bacterium]|nr:LLM class F420-dependent oxidoreductase [Dehalococcoidia bacterium]
MEMGVSLPEHEHGIGSDLVAVRDFAQAADSLGYSYLSTGDHVLGANPASRRDWNGPFTHRDLWHEPFVLYGYLAGITQRIRLVTGVIILPQRQTALVAKQAAEVDVLSGGRLRLGVGLGWNEVEYEALGESFTNRGRRSVEQIELLRALWTQEVVDFKGRYHHVTYAGINPLPVQRPIPIWLGGAAERVVRRVGGMGDGWFPQFRPDSAGQARLEQMREYARQAGRDPSSIGIEGRVSLAGGGGPQDWNETVRAWAGVGAT